MARNLQKTCFSGTNMNCQDQRKNYATNIIVKISRKITLYISNKTNIFLNLLLKLQNT